MGGTGRGAQTRRARARERERLLDEAARVSVGEFVDVAVLGGGAAGLAAAISAAEAGARVVVLERDSACGRTILATGNGRCNFCNERLEARRYNDPELARAVMGEPDEALGRVLSFFRDCGLAWASEDGRLYPRSRQAASVRSVLLSRARRAGVTLAAAREVTGLRRRTGGAGGSGSHGQARWEVSFRQPRGQEGARLACRCVVVATGGGSSGLLEGLGVPRVPDSPTLCPVACDAGAPGLLDELDGRRAHARLTLSRGRAVVARESGEVLFRPYGISGIVAFDLSRKAMPGDAVSVDLAPDVDAFEVDRLVAASGNAWDSLDGILDPVIARALLGRAGRPGESGLAWRVAPLVKELPLRVRGLADTERAQVMRGGVAAGALDAASLEVTGLPGLHCCGEAVDVDGACGGFNLAWAWLSGMSAGRAAANEACAAARGASGGPDAPTTRRASAADD